MAREVWINYTAGVPIVADFMSTGGQGPALCINRATGELYYLAAGDAVTAVPGGGGGYTDAEIDAFIAGRQPLDSDLTAIAALTTTAFGRTFLDLADAAAARTKLALGTAALSATGDFQPNDADLTAIAALTTTAHGRAYLALADAAAGRAHLALGTAATAASTDFQPNDADLTAIAALTTTAFGRTFLDLADAAAARTKLALGTAAQSASGDFQPIDSDLTAIAALTTTAYGRALLTLADGAALTALGNNFTSALKGLVPLSGGGTSNYLRADGSWAVPPGAAGAANVHMAADAAARGPAIADYFASTLSLDATSTYEIRVTANFLKTTAGTITWTWLFSNAPIFCTSRYEATPVTGYTDAAVTGAPVQAQSTSKGIANPAHAASGSLTTLVDHSFMFWLTIRTNAATTVQLRSTEGAGTITPRMGSYMEARKIA